MATIISESKWPSASTEKLAKTWLEMGDVPEWLKIVWSGTEGDIEKGVRGLVLYQCDDSKLADALFFVKNDSVRFYDKVPGFSCSVVVWTEPADGLKMLGMG